MNPSFMQLIGSNDQLRHGPEGRLKEMWGSFVSMYNKILHEQDTRNLSRPISFSTLPNMRSILKGA
jgi:hypothetical protein